MKKYPLFITLAVVSFLHTACEKDNIKTPSTEPAVLNKILYHKETAPNQYHLYLMDEDGSAEVALTNSTNLTASYADWSNDGKTIFFQYRNTNSLLAFNDIYSTSMDGTNTTQITNTSSDNETNVVLSPDNTKMLFLSTSTLFVADIDGSNKLQLTDPNNLQVSNPTWSADGTKIIFSANSTPSLHSIAPDGTGLAQLSSSKYPNSAPMFLGNKMLFTAVSNTSSTSQLFESNLDGTNLVQLTTNDTDKAILSAALSPDKSKLLLSAYVYSTSKIEFFISNTDGSNQQRFVSTTDYSLFDATWSPNSNQIAFTAVVTATNQTDIFRVNLDGTNLTQLTNSAAKETYLIWR